MSWIWLRPSRRGTLIEKVFQVICVVLNFKTVLRTIFDLTFDNVVYYHVWEDPVVDLEALQLDPSSRVLCIASAGCNILAYLSEPCRRIVGVDFNRHHVALTELKIAALLWLPTYEDFFRFFGKADQPENADAYKSYIKPNLGDGTRRYWETARMCGGSRISSFSVGFYRTGPLAKFIGAAHFFARARGRDLSSLVRARSMEEQRTLYQSVLEPLFREPLVRLAARLPMTLFPLGVPSRQYQLMARSAVSGNIIDDLGSRVARLACHFPIGENPFAWQAFARQYDTSSRRAIPFYLEPNVYDVIRLRAQSVELYNISLAEFLRRQRDGTFDRFILLDSQDWMSEEQLIQLWRELGRVSNPDGARVVFRTAARESPYNRLPRELRQQWVYDDLKSKQLYSRDRSAIYGGFHLYHRSSV